MVQRAVFGLGHRYRILLFTSLLTDTYGLGGTSWARGRGYSFPRFAVGSLPRTKPIESDDTRDLKKK